MMRVLPTIILCVLIKYCNRYILCLYKSSNTYFEVFGSSNESGNRKNETGKWNFNFPYQQIFLVTIVLRCYFLAGKFLSLIFLSLTAYQKIYARIKVKD